MPFVPVALSFALWAHLPAGQTTPRQPEPTAAMRRLLDSAEKLPAKSRLPRLQKAYDAAARRHDRVGLERALYLRGKCFHDLSQNAQALRALECALQVANLAHDRIGQIDVLNETGSVLNDLSKISRAQKIFSESLSLARASGDRSGAEAALAGLGSICDDLGQKQEALGFFSQALEIERRAGHRSSEGSFLNRIGLIYAELGHKHKALNTYSQALLIRKQVGDRIGEETTLNNIGVVYDDLGWKQKALECYERALAIERQVGDRSGEGATLTNIGDVYDGLGQRQKALGYYLQALPIERQVRQRSNEGTTLNNIGWLYDELGQKQKALDYYAQALPTWRELRDRSGEGMTLNNIGSIYDDLGQQQKALDYYAQALLIRVEVGDRSGEAATLNNVGFVYEHLGQSQKALDFYARALPIEQEVGDREKEAITQRNVARTLRNMGADRVAVVEYKLAVNVVQSLRKDIKGLATESQTSFVKQYEAIYRELADLLVSQGRLAEAQEVLDLLKDAEYFQFLRRGSRETVDLTTLEKTWQDRYDAIGGDIAKASYDLDVLRKRPEMQSGAPTPEQKASLRDLTAKLDKAKAAFQAFIEDARTAFAKAPHDEDRISDLKTTRQLAGYLDRQTVPTAGIYTLVSQDGVRTILTLPLVTELRQGPMGKIKLEDLYRKIAALRRALCDPRYDPVPLASELYDIVVRPLLPELQAAHVKRMMWSLDGPLRYLPLAALYDREAHKYLIEEYPSHLFIPSELLETARGGAPGAVGFGTTVERRIGPDDLPALGGVKEELDALHDRLGAHVYLDSQFTKDALEIALLSRPGVVHVATHFVLRPGEGRNSYLLLGDGKPLPIAEFAGWFDNSAHTDLLVLSACDTATPGNADADGGEYEGFARVAQQNGAAAVIATLWPVSDRSTAILMSRFYRLRQANPTGGVLDTLREAQRWLMAATPADLAAELKADGIRSTIVNGGEDKTLPPFKSDPNHPYAHPFYWAPFVLTGNPG
jgi:CHAT domain-containing protein/Tfp pilus assembly protein PilF